MSKIDDMFPDVLLDYVNIIKNTNNGNANNGIPNYSVSKLETTVQETQKRVEKCVKELGIEDAPRPENPVRTLGDDFEEWEDGEVVEEKGKEILSEEEKNTLKKYLDRFMAIFLAASIAISAGTLGLIYLKHKDDPKPWQREESNVTTTTRYDPSKPNFVVTPTPVDKPVIPTDNGYIELEINETNEDESLDERED